MKEKPFYEFLAALFLLGLLAPASAVAQDCK